MSHPVKSLVRLWLALTRRSRRMNSGPGLDVILYGEMLGDRWRASLGPVSPIWRDMPDVARVTRAPRGLGALLVAGADRDTVVIPLIERDVHACPPGGRRLAPTPESCDVYEDKRRFAAFVEAQGLGGVAAGSLRLEAPGVFPCVLKRVDERNGRGIVRIEDARDLAARLADPTWRGRDVVLQEWIDGAEEYVTHLVCERGRVLWHRTYVYGLLPGETIRNDRRIASRTVVDLRDGDLAAMERFLVPTGYDGPCNVNFKRRADGRIAVFEINPRFGGSLMRPDGLADLAEAVRVLIDHARA